MATATPRTRSLITLYDEDWNRYTHPNMKDRIAELPDDIGVVCYGIAGGYKSRKGSKPVCEHCGQEMDRPSYVGKYELVNSKSGRCRNLAHWKLVDSQVEELPTGRGQWHTWKEILYEKYNKPLGVPHNSYGPYRGMAAPTYYSVWNPGDKQRQLTKKELADWLLVHNLRQLGPK